MRLPKLHLRDLFWLVALLGLALSWRLDRHRLNEDYGWLLKVLDDL
jgi:hypothetical protein